MVFAIEEARDLPYILGSVYLAKVCHAGLGDHINRDILQNERLLPLAGFNDFCFIIDGQQRTTTFFLFLLALNDPEVSSRLFNSGIPKIVPGKVDYEYFLNLVAGENAEPKTKSNRRIKYTLDYFKRRLKDFPRREDLKSFVQKNLQVVKIVVEDNMELAGTLFVSQTDRGKRLTNLDKLKSTLMFYSQKVEKDADAEVEIDNLFGALFETVENLCSLKIYSRPDQAEGDVLRIMNFMLLRENFYRNFLNDLITNEADKNRKVEVWYESGEDRIYEAINKVFRESLVLRKDNIKVIIPCLVQKLRSVFSFLKYVAEVGVPREEAEEYKDLYGNKTWYPFKQLFAMLGLSVFSKSLLAEILRNTPPNAPCLLEPMQTITKHPGTSSLNLFEQVDRVKRVQSKLSGLETPSAASRDIELLRLHPELFSFLQDSYRTTLKRIDEFKQFATRPATIFNIIEENELGIWKIGKRPVGSFIWGSDTIEEIIDHVRSFSFGYKRDYLVRDLGYGNFKYLLFEYERLVHCYSDEELCRVFDYDIDEEDGIQIHREHIFAQNAVNYGELKDTWLTSTNENYDDWIWNIGNIALLEHTINIGNAGNRTVREKAAYYMQSAFKGTRTIGEQINHLQQLIDAAHASSPDTDRQAERQYVSHLPFKILFEIRELEMLGFAFYRFA